VFQGFKDWGSLSIVWLLTSFIFSFAALLWFALFFFFLFLFHCFARAYSLYLGYHFFLVIWACPLAFEFLGLFYLLAFSRLYHISWSLKFHLPPGVGCDLSRDFFFRKEKLFRLKKRSQGMYLFQNVKGITKMAFPHFKRKQLRSINFDLIQCDGLVFAKMHSMSYEQQVHYIPLFIHLKTHVSRVMG